MWRIEKSSTEFYRLHSNGALGVHYGIRQDIQDYKGHSLVLFKLLHFIAKQPCTLEA